MNPCGKAPSTSQKSKDVTTTTNPPVQKYWLHGGFYDFWLDTEFNPRREGEGEGERQKRVGEEERPGSARTGARKEDSCAEAR